MISPRDLLDYFIAPIKTGYDFPKTLVFALVFIFALYLVYLFLKKIKVKVDRRFAVAVVPYVVFGGTLRVLKDLGLLTSYWFVTPGIYFLVLFLIIAVLLLSLLLQKKLKIPYFKTLFVIGILLISFNVSQIRFVNSNGAVLVAIFYLPWVLLFYFSKRWGLENRIVSAVQMFDATTTATAMTFFGYGEQHVLPNIFINLFGSVLFGPFSFVVLKIVGVVLVLVLIDRLSDDKEFSNYLKLAIGILGLATGTRDFTCLLSLCTPS
jgi:uncharacterized membrane protein